jgi:hypothetical protein
MSACGLDSSGLGYGLVVGSCGHINKPSGAMKGEKFLVFVNDYQVLNDFSVWDIRYMAFKCQFKAVGLRFIAKQTNTGCSD